MRPRSPNEPMILPEIHEHYTIQAKVAEKGYWVYDFALPVMVLHAIYSGDGTYLKRWLDMCPRHQFTTLDTHDGIGIVDVRDLLPDEAVDFTKERMFSQGANVKRVYNTEAYNNLDVYQVNTTYYSALGDDDAAYLLARAVQFFAPGHPHGLLRRAPGRQERPRAAGEHEGGAQYQPPLLLAGGDRRGGGAARGACAPGDDGAAQLAPRLRRRGRHGGRDSLCWQARHQACLGRCLGPARCRPRGQAIRDHPLIGLCRAPYPTTR
ncbi:MAG: hypothetical protein LKE37_10445 [Atopobiaceae bacterium]|nr:hypothetical protein [Atopobiaceae bacterium]